MFLRFRIKKCISILSNAAVGDTIPLDVVKDLYLGKYAGAMRYLEAHNYIDVGRAWGNDIIRASITKSHFVDYTLSRQDIWINRIGGFVAGILVSVISHFLIILL